MSELPTKLTEYAKKPQHSALSAYALRVRTSRSVESAADEAARIALETMAAASSAAVITPMAASAAVSAASALSFPPETFEKIRVERDTNTYW